MSLELLPPAQFLTGLFFLGLLIGSFLNVVILRLPARLEHEWHCQCSELLGLSPSGESPLPPSIVHGRSHCPRCGHGIRAWENIPVLSWLILRGKCSSCGGWISIRYPVVEITTAILFLVAGLQFGPSVQCLAVLILTSMLICLVGVDIDHQLLPDNLTLSLLWLGLSLNLFEVFAAPTDAIVGALAGYLSLWTVYHLFRLLTGKEGMGHGDFKLLSAFGAWMGWQALPFVILVSSLVGALTGIGLMLIGTHRKDRPLPFGPFLAVAGMIYVYLQGPISEFIRRWYGISL